MSASGVEPPKLEHHAAPDRKSVGSRQTNLLLRSAIRVASPRRDDILGHFVRGNIKVHLTELRFRQDIRKIRSAAVP